MLLALITAAMARCPEPDEVRLLLLYPLDTASGSGGSGASFHRDSVVTLAAGPSQQSLRAQAGLCDWNLSAEVRGDLLSTTTLSPMVGAARSRTVGRMRGTLGGLVGTQGLDAMAGARLWISRPSTRLTPYVLGEGWLVRGSGWAPGVEAGIRYGLRDHIAVGAAGTLSQAGWGGHVSLSLMP